MLSAQKQGVAAALSSYHTRPPHSFKQAGPRWEHTSSPFSILRGTKNLGLGIQRSVRTSLTLPCTHAHRILNEACDREGAPSPRRQKGASVPAYRVVLSVKGGVKGRLGKLGARRRKESFPNSSGEPCPSGFQSRREMQTPAHSLVQAAARLSYHEHRNDNASFRVV